MCGCRGNAPTSAVRTLGFNGGYSPPPEQYLVTLPDSSPVTVDSEAEAIRLVRVRGGGYRRQSASV
jgi:hypothetical protein